MTTSRSSLVRVEQASERSNSKLRFSVPPNKGIQEYRTVLLVTYYRRRWRSSYILKHVIGKSLLNLRL
ncbi:12201_t:CDS:2 [Ambispora leptoticha]|uniref:12201_t:CDS:1 n=1 Tax=Ambispora leptoticha TaxID=144679 RepID=A0A9N9HMJ1_9GLOM|nr:12201_t:CDS:2 [Ambispora leptoticha]